MENSNFTDLPEIFGKIKPSKTELDFKYAVKKFSQNAPAASIPRLYEAYRWIKQQRNPENDEGHESNKQFTNFIEVFLRILEERGAVKSEIYSEVLRDSAEYKYLKGLFYDEKEDGPLFIEVSETAQKFIPEIKKITLKDILTKKNKSIKNISINDWHRIVDGHLSEFKTEDLFVKNCTAVVNSIRKITQKETYHVEIIVVYAFDKLLKYKTLSLHTKDFAMQMLNLMLDRGDIWTALHKEYLEIIKK